MSDEFIFDSDDLITFCSEFEGTLKDEITESFLEVTLQDLGERWSNVQKSYRSLCTDKEEKPDKKLLESARAKYTACTKSYHKCKSKILDLQKDFSAQNLSTTDQGPITEDCFAHIKVPPCDTDIFYGGYEEWPSFRDMFTAVYIDNPKIPDVQKLYYLRLKVQGRAASIIRKYQLCSQNFSLAWEALEDRYENQRILVENQIKILLNLPSIAGESSKALQSLQTTVNDCLSAIKAQNVPISEWDPFIIILCASKLPIETLSLWEQSLESHRKLVKWEQMDAFLSHRCEVVERLEYRNKELLPHPHKKEHTLKVETTKAESTHKAEGTQHPCKVCMANHSLKNCPQFLRLDPQARNKFVSNNKICLNCLAYTHIRKDCPSKYSCAHCKKNHHTLLHFFRNDTQNNSFFREQRPETSAQGRERGALPTDTHMANLESKIFEENILLPTARVQIKHQGESFNVRAFLDQGSERTFISKKLQQQLMLPTKHSAFRIHGIGGQLMAHSNSLCELTLYAKEFDRYIDVEAIVVPKITRMLPRSPLKNSDIAMEALTALELADPDFDKCNHVDLLIGSNILPQILLEGVKRVSHTLMTQFTIFGWVISGPIKTESVSSYSIGVEEIASDTLGDQLRKFWEQEEVPTQRPVSKEDEYCEALFQKTTFRNNEGRYVVKLPFKPEFPRNMFLGTSRSTANAQFCHMERTLNRKPELAEMYKSVLEEYIKLNHIEPTVSSENISRFGCNSFYLPHHAVVKPESRSTKVRVVFNASKKTSSGLSLNDVLHVGPTLQADLMSLVLKWRLYQFVFNGDIEKMYRQILVHKEDTQFQRILFRRNQNDPIRDYVLRTVTFGVNCAPYLAIRSLIQLARESHEKFPKAAYILTEETYVDDILSGSHDVPSAVDSLSQVISVLSTAGFPLKKITSNSPQILATVSSENILDSDFLRFKETSATKTLGIQWNALSDCFSYTIGPVGSTNMITNRQILSTIAKLFDPAGWISPIIIQAKLILQQLWLEGAGWDEPVKPCVLEVWNRFSETLHIISSLKIPRWVGYAPARITQIHGFCDASEKAYCAAIYLRIETYSEIISNLFVSKTKVAPINPVSLPRLELCGAVLLSKLVGQVTKDLPIHKYDLFLWTDSSIVLGWLEKPPNTWKTYVANRTAQIMRNVGNVPWRHVKSGDNPADLGSRGCNPSQLIESSLWWKGPVWLQKRPEDWPKPLVVSGHSQESKNTISFHVYAKCEDQTCITEDLLERFSKWDKAVRVITYVLRFIDAIRQSLRSQSKPQTARTFDVQAVEDVVGKLPRISCQEFTKTKYKLIHVAQVIHYREEFLSLASHKQVNKKSSLYTVNPYIDENNIIRANGRISNANLSFDECHPIILPVRSTFCRLFIDFTHRLLMHAEINLMLRAIRGEYFVARLRPTLRSFIRKCVTCIRYKKQVKSQLMGALPKERSSFSLPFTVTGLDFAGPFPIKTSIIRNAPYHKSYVCVFVCFCTKAIHLELCSELTSNSFQAAFIRFVGRRGLPKKIMSDNGTNFVGAERSFRLEYEEFIRTAAEDIAEKYVSHGFQWAFIPPNAPHMGGLWEAGVRSFKSHFKKVAQNNKYTFEEFTTLLTRIESVLNSRPLSPMSDDPNELLALTPGHFLRGAPLMAFPEVPTDSLSLRNRWEKLKIMHHQFAQRWKDEYLKELQKRFKWQNLEENIIVGQLVIVKDDLLPPSEWKLARIIKIYFGNDGLVRVADLKTQTGVITRAISKLCVLPAATVENST